MLPRHGSSFEMVSPHHYQGVGGESVKSQADLNLLKRPYSFMKGRRESLADTLKQNEQQVKSKQMIYSKNPYL